jgi:hypothetical protein
MVKRSEEKEESPKSSRGPRAKHRLELNPSALKQRRTTMGTNTKGAIVMKKDKKATMLIKLSSHAQ